MVQTILIYSGKDYFLSTGLGLSVKNGQRVEKGSAITDPFEYSVYEKTDDGIRFTREEINEKNMV